MSSDRKNVAPLELFRCAEASLRDVLLAPVGLTTNGSLRETSCRVVQRWRNSGLNPLHAFFEYIDFIKIRLRCSPGFQ
jgi:hypothetical protein